MQGKVSRGLQEHVAPIGGREMWEEGAASGKLEASTRGYRVEAEGWGKRMRVVLGRPVFNLWAAGL